VPLGPAFDKKLWEAGGDKSDGQMQAESYYEELKQECWDAAIDRMLIIEEELKAV
jgi:hypothetical protein